MQRTILFLILLIVTPLSLAQTATGRVFIDENRNGLLDEGEVGLANVRVSNGASVVRTDATGRYRLAADEQTIIFITKPSNYAIPVNQHMLPQFYYIHQPNGSPAGMRYKGIEPTGPLPAEINFPLIERPEKKNLRRSYSPIHNPKPLANWTIFVMTWLPSWSAPMRLLA